jgi:hypothetical protein
VDVEEQFAANLKRARDAAGISQEALGVPLAELVAGIE